MADATRSTGVCAEHAVALVHIPYALAWACPVCLAEERDAAIAESEGVPDLRRRLAEAEALLGRLAAVLGESSRRVFTADAPQALAAAREYLARKEGKGG